MSQIRLQKGSKPSIAVRAFQWITCSRRPLPPALLVAAVCQDPDSDEVIEVDIDSEIVLQACHNLLVVDSQLNVCKFSHLSVQEYFESHLWTQSEANRAAGQVCLSLLNDANYQLEEMYLEEDEISMGNLSLLNQYARLHWFKHIQESYVTYCYSRLALRLKNFLGSMNESSLAYQNWYTAFSHPRNDHDFSINYRGIQDVLSPCALGSLPVCKFSFHEILEDWWNTATFDVEKQNDSGLTLIQITSRYGHLSLAQILLDRGADVNARGEKYGSALQAASYFGHLSIVQLLLKEGADFNAKGGFYGNALQAACAGGHLTIVQMLLKEGANVNAEGGFYGNALQAASRSSVEIVQLLIEKGAAVNANGGYYGSALQAASHNYRLEVVQVLLDKGAEVNAQGGKYGNALQAATCSGELEVVQFLLSNGAEVDAQGEVYGTALQAACSVPYCSSEIVRLLLDRGANVNATGGEYGNALRAALSSWSLENETAARLLLENGADTNSAGDLLEKAQRILSEGAE